MPRISVDGKIVRANPFSGWTRFLKKLRFHRHQSSGFTVRPIINDILSHFENHLTWKELFKDNIKKIEILSPKVHLCAGKVLQAPYIIRY